jgi:NAD(P)-dependent dehydrogenase (short-subunit alcohol dehydrogenase family)
LSYILVTGPSRGVGRATALALATRGVDVALLGRASAELERTQEEVAARVHAPLFACDLTLSDQIENAAREIQTKLGAPEAIIHNAGVVRRAAIEATDLSAYDEQLAVNLRAPFLLTRAFLPAMRQARRGRIVFVASISSTLGSPGAAAYCASKWGVVGFMKSLAEEIKDSGLMTVAVLPGSIDTDMLKGSGFPARMTAEDVARTLVHYALDAPLAHNGASIEMFGV